MSKGNNTSTCTYKVNNQGFLKIMYTCILLIDKIPDKLDSICRLAVKLSCLLYF